MECFPFIRIITFSVVISGLSPVASSTTTPRLLTFRTCSMPINTKRRLSLVINLQKMTFTFPLFDIPTSDNQLSFVDLITKGHDHPKKAMSIYLTK